MEAANIPPLEEITSSMFRRVGYDEENYVLYVEEHPKPGELEARLYAVEDVAPEQFFDLKAAPSFGRHFAMTLKANPHLYPMRCLNPREEVKPSVRPGAYVTEDEAVNTAIELAAQVKQTITIRSADDYRLALANAVELKREIRKREQFFADTKASAYRTWKSICEMEKKATAPLVQSEAELTRAAVAWYEAQQAARRRQQQEAENRALEAAREVAIREMGLTAEDARSLDPAKEETVRIKAAINYIPPEVVEAPIPQVEGVSLLEDWTYEITDEMKIPVTVEFYSLDPKKLAAYAKRMKGHATAPGLRVYQATKTRKTTGKK
jgi:hypothetical protein